MQAAELQALKAQEEAQNAQAAAQSAASSTEHWKSRCGLRKLTQISHEHVPARLTKGQMRC